jgi:hypothetical protein
MNADVKIYIDQQLYQLRKELLAKLGKLDVSGVVDEEDIRNVIESMNITKGEKGDPGDDYILTDEDKAEITQAVLAALPDGDEVFY